MNEKKLRKMYEELIDERIKEMILRKKCISNCGFWELFGNDEFDEIMDDFEFDNNFENEDNFEECNKIFMEIGMRRYVEELKSEYS